MENEESISISNYMLENWEKKPHTNFVTWRFDPKFCLKSKDVAS